jgi:aspartate carbamoyltransferase regulatory subunit
VTETTVIPKIENGIVIDHIPQGRGIEILRLLQDSGVTKTTEIALGVNLPSTRMKRKDIVKIWGPDLPEGTLALVSLIAPGATVKMIQAYKVHERIPLTLPETISGLLRCPNPGCISNTEPGVRSKFLTRDRVRQIVGCGYCERRFGLGQLSRV